MENTVNDNGAAVKTKREKTDYISIFSRVILAISFITVIYYMLGPSEGYLHSDCVDTMTWAAGSVESGKIFNPTFYYPCLLPFGSTFLVYPFMKLFGFTMFTYRLSMFVFMLLFTTALYFTLRGLKWNKNICLITIALELMAVSSGQKLRELFWEHIIYYSLGAFLALALLAMVFAFIRYYDNNGYSFKNCKKAVIFAVCCGLWALLSAFDGVTVLALSSLPVLFALLGEIVIYDGTPILSEKNRAMGISAVIIAVCTVLGSIFLKIAAADIATSYAGAYSVISDSNEWGNNLLNFLKQWTSLLGADYYIGESVTKGANVIAAIKMAGSLILFFVPVYALFIYRKFNRYERILLFYHWIMTAFVLYGFIFGNLSGVNWRLTPIICSAVVVNMAVWKQLFASVDKRRLLALISSLVILSCAITSIQILTMPSDYGRDNELHKAMELLEENDLDYGYATYWNANVITLLSSSRVKVRDIYIEDEDIKNGWLNSDKTWFEDQPGQEKYFVLLTNAEYESALEREHIILDDTVDTIREGNWVVLVKDKNIF